MFRRPGYTPNELRSLRKSIFTKVRLSIECEENINRAFRETKLFKTTVFIRISYLIFLLSTLVLGDLFGSSQKEIVIEKNKMVHHSSTKYGSSTRITYETITDFGAYAIDQKSNGAVIKVGDTLIIDRNVYGKAIYFTKANWFKKFDISLNYAYYIVFLATFLSLFLLRVQFKFANVFLLLISCIDLVAYIAYFVT